jgi:hypothetical protein
MKIKIAYVLFVTGLLALIAPVAGNAQASTVALPGPSHSAMVSWTAPANCTSTAPCTFQVYRTTGTAACTVGSPGWTFVATTAPQVGSYSDSTVSGGATYTYAIFVVQPSQPMSPPACGTGTIPNDGAPVTNVTVKGQ